MAIKTSSSVGHFVLRLAGVTGLFAGIVGLVLWLAVGEDWAMYLAAAGGALLLLAIIFDVPVLMQGIMTRRGAVGGTVLLQIILATVLFTGLNLFSFFHYSRLDLTSDERFTLDATLREQLAKLDQETTIVIFQRHTSFGQSAENPPDNYDFAAERQIVEKVRDLAELFQDLGPRFRVEVLDIHDDNYEDQLKRYKDEKPDLARAIESVKENSIFFYATKPGEQFTAIDVEDLAGGKKLEEISKKREHGYVQVLSFNDLYQLDRRASRDEATGKRNLVLRDQGVGAFAHKILNIQEKRPRIAFAVAHEFLGVKGDNLLWGMGGVQKVLDARGIEHRDIVLKKFGAGPPTHTVLTHEESRYERAESVISELETIVEEQRKTFDLYTDLKKDFEGMTEDEVNKKYFFLARPGRPLDVFSESELEQYKKDRGWREGRDYARVDRRINAEFRQFYLENRVLPILRETTQALEVMENKLKQEREVIGSLNVERLYEQKRITDLRSKFNRMLADCDMLVIPRLTLLDALRNPPLEYELHKLEDPQVAAIKDFIKSGRPVLFLMDPPFENANIIDEKGDGVDELLRELGVEMPAQTVLFDVEVESFMQGKGSGLRIGRLAEVPPVLLDPVKHTAPRGMTAQAPPKEPHPIRESLLVAGRSLSSDLPKDLRLKNPRPIYLMRMKPSPKAAATAVAEGFLPFSLGTAGPLLAEGLRPDESAVVLSTSKEGWNTEKPFADEDIPRYTTPTSDNPNIGTWKEPRRGPFPVAIAFETRVPASWADSKEPLRNVRLGVIGDGEIFKGETLTPMREKLLLDYSNWLMGRDDLLARSAGQPWAFLRVGLSDGPKLLWTLVMWLGLPMLFVYLGTIVMLKRRLR